MSLPSATSPFPVIEKALLVPTMPAGMVSVSPPSAYQLGVDTGIVHGLGGGILLGGALGALIAYLVLR